MQPKQNIKMKYSTNAPSVEAGLGIVPSLAEPACNEHVLALPSTQMPQVDPSIEQPLP